MSREKIDAEIVELMKKDANRGFRRLMEVYQQPLYWHIRRLVVNHADAQDVAQETLIRAFRSFDSLRDDASLRAWLYRIATNEAIRLLNKRKEERAMEIDDPDGTETFALMADEHVDFSDLEAVHLQEAILSLPQKQQLAFNLRYYDELPYEEIARITDSKEATVKVNYHIAKNKIVEYIKNHA